MRQKRKQVETLENVNTGICFQHTNAEANNGHLISQLSVIVIKEVTVKRVNGKNINMAGSSLKKPRNVKQDDIEVPHGHFCMQQHEFNGKFHHLCEVHICVSM